MTGANLQNLREMADRHIGDVPEGEPLSPLDEALIRFAIASSPFVLDPVVARAAGEAALSLGATSRQLHTVVVLVSGVGVHALMEGTRLVASICGTDPKAPFNNEQQMLWDELIGDRPVWQNVERECQGFLAALLHQSPRAFRNFVESAAIPWQERALSPLQMEFICAALDALPMQRYGPGLRLHLDGAIRLGAGRRQLISILDLAGAADPHRGIP